MLIPYSLSIFMSSVHVINRHLSAVQFARLFPGPSLICWLHDGFLHRIVPLASVSLPFGCECALHSLSASRSPILVHRHLQLWFTCCCGCYFCCCSVTKSHLILLQPHGLQPSRFLCPLESPGKNPGLGLRLLPQGIFPAQGSSLHLLWLLHWRVDSLPLSHQGSLAHTYWTPNFSSKSLI